MKSNSRVLRGWRDFGVKATAIILTILLATQMVGTPAFASGALTNKQASEDIATTVDDTGVESSGTEATDTTVPGEAAGTESDPAPADSTQATEEPVAETAESATEPATETPAADPAANAVSGTEPEPAPAPAVEQDQLASIELNLADGASITLSKDGNKIDDDTNPVDVPANEELKFTAAAPEGMQISAVKTFINGVETELTADANGEYKVAADKVTDKLTVKVETVEVVEDPAADAAEAEQPEATDEESAESDAIEEDAEESTPEMAVNEALQKLDSISFKATARASHTVEVGKTIWIEGSSEGAFPSHEWSIVGGEGLVELSNTDNQTVGIKGVSEGVVTLKHKYKRAVGNWKEETFTIQVVPAPTVEIAEDELVLTLGDSGKLNATATPDGSVISWSSSSERVASVDENGNVTTHQTGVATITAKNGSATDTASVIVNAPASYRLIYNSNYPDNAKKIVYTNGNAGEIKLEDAVETNAVYTYEPDSEAVISGDMTLANYEFLGWSTDPEAVTPDSAYEPGSAVVMESNLTLYAVWGNEIEIGSKTSVIVRYHGYGEYPWYVDKATAAFLSRNEGSQTYTFVLGNNQDTINSSDSSLRGWTLGGENYAFNETVTTSNYKHLQNGQVLIEVNPWKDESATYAQFFVLKPDATKYGAAGEYYSVGTGSIDSALFNEHADNVTVNGNVVPTYPDGVEDKSNNISELIESAPSPTQIASTLNISLDEAQSVRWYVAKKQSDGYHVDGVIYKTGVYHNVKFVDTNTGEVLASYVVEDMGTVLKNQIPDMSSSDDFEYWIDEDGNQLDVSQNISLIGQDLTFYTKYADRYNVTASIIGEDGQSVEGATVHPLSQSVREGGAVAACCLHDSGGLHH